MVVAYDGIAPRRRVGAEYDHPSRSWPIVLKNSFSGATREASLLLGRGEPCNLLLRATRTVLTSAATIRRVNCREQRTLTRIRSMWILEFSTESARKLT